MPISCPPSATAFISAGNVSIEWPGINHVVLMPSRPKSFKRRGLPTSPANSPRDAGALVFECRFAGAAANTVEQKVSDLRVGPGGARVELGTAMLAQGRLGDAEHARNVRLGNAVGGHRLGLPPLRVSRGPNRSSHWKIRR